MWQEYFGCQRSTGYLELAMSSKLGQNRVLQEVAQQAQRDCNAREMTAALAEEVRGPHSTRTSTCPMPLRLH
jgi:hypothetical protein